MKKTLFHQQIKFDIAPNVIYSVMTCLWQYRFGWHASLQDRLYSVDATACVIFCARTWSHITLLL
jgi:hypothetical protein